MRLVTVIAIGNPPSLSGILWVPLNERVVNVDLLRSWWAMLVAHKRSRDPAPGPGSDGEETIFPGLHPTLECNRQNRVWGLLIRVHIWSYIYFPKVRVKVSQCP
jgi:hypothetical protein